MCVPCASPRAKPHHTRHERIEVGNGDFDADGDGELAEAQARSHFSMWSVMKAVMLLGNDLTKMGPKTLEIIKNPHAISINQV